MRRLALFSVAFFALSAGCSDDPTAPTDQPAEPSIPPALAIGRSEQGASITTDKDDYAPGETVVLTGAGWQAGETVEMVLNEDPADAAHAPTTLTSVADENGAFVNREFTVDVRHLGVTFTLVATGQTSGQTLRVVFTDGNIHVALSPATLVGPYAVSWKKYNQSTTCEGNSSDGTTAFPTTGSSAPALGLGQGQSGSFTVPAIPGYKYTGYSKPNDLTVTPASSETATTLCVSGFQGNGSKTLTLNYEAAATQTATTLDVAPAAGVAGGTTTLTATLKAGSTGVSGKTITFSLNGTAVSPTATTDAQGVATLTGVSLAGIAAGTYATGVGASFAGDGTHQASSGSASLTVAAGTGLTVSPATGTYGGTASLVATLTSGGSGVGGKTISFTLNGAAKGTAPTNAEGVATLAGVSLTGINVGTHTGAIGASFAGDASHASASGSADLTVEQATQTITFSLTSLPAKKFGDADFSIASYAQGGASGNPVTFASTTPSKCTVNSDGSVLHIVEAGVCTIKASQAGNANYKAATDVESSFTIQQVATTTTIGSSKSSSTYGEEITLTATVKPVVSGGSTIGTVQFKNGAAALGSAAALSCGATECTATLKVSNLSAVGSPHSITAEYSGNVNFLGSTSTTPVSQTVNPAPLTGKADDKSRVFGAPNPPFTVTYTNFVLGETDAIVTGTLSCTTTADASSPVSGSPYAINCSGQSAPNYTITYQPGQLTVTPAGTSVALGTVPAVVFGQPSVSLSATVSAVSPSAATVNEGTVTFTITQGAFTRSVTSAAVSGGAAGATLSLAGAPVGSYSVAATYNPAGGVPNFLTSSATPPGSLSIRYNTAVGHAFLQPINPNLTTGNRSTFKIGSTIPTKFQLFLADGTTPVSTAQATISVLKLDNTAPGTVNEEVISLPVDAGTTFRYDASGQQYIFNLGTKSWSAGTYRITATLDDGTTIVAEVDGRSK